MTIGTNLKIWLGFDSKSLKLDHDMKSDHFESLSIRLLTLKQLASFEDWRKSVKGQGVGQKHLGWMRVKIPKLGTKIYKRRKKSSLSWLYYDRTTTRCPRESFPLSNKNNSRNRVIFRAILKDFSSAAYFLSFVFHCIAYIKSFTFARKWLYFNQEIQFRYFWRAET